MKQNDWWKLLGAFVLGWIVGSIVKSEEIAESLKGVVRKLIGDTEGK